MSFNYLDSTIFISGKIENIFVLTESRVEVA